jgi:hypothetical protein
MNVWNKISSQFGNPNGFLGSIAILHHPRKPGATELDAVDAGYRISFSQNKANFQNITVHKKT